MLRTDYYESMTVRQAKLVIYDRVRALVWEIKGLISIPCYCDRFIFTSSGWLVNGG